MNDTLTIIFRASDYRFGVHAKNRFFSDSKTEVSKRCFNSLYSSFKNFSNRVKFIVLGDRLSLELEDFFKSFSNITLHTYTGGNKTGLRDNINEVLNLAHNVDTDWVWLQEDDYLFVNDTAEKIFDLIDNRETITKSNRNLVIYPADYSDRYTRQKDGSQQYQIFLGNNNYWREIHNTTFSWCIDTSHLSSLSELFKQMFVEIKYKNFDTFLSNKVWSTNNTLIVSPLPSLSVHLDDHVRLPPCINWEEVWNASM
jgi:hypothetical protein